MDKMVLLSKPAPYKLEMGGDSMSWRIEGSYILACFLKTMMQYVLGGSCFSELNIHSFRANISQQELYYGIGEESEFKKKIQISNHM